MTAKKVLVLVLVAVLFLPGVVPPPPVIPAPRTVDVPAGADDILMHRAISLAENGRPGGIKRTSYALLYNLNMYGATGEPQYKERAGGYAAYLAAAQEEDGGWSETGGLSSSYRVLESSMATWALSEAALAGVGGDLSDEIRGGGDFLAHRRDLLTFYGIKDVLGLKPNAMAFLAVGLAEAYQATGDPIYREKALGIADSLLGMQGPDGSWYDGPYYLPGYGWRTTSSWYQAMAVMGLASAYEISGDEMYRSGALMGIRWFTVMEKEDGNIRGVRYSNGTVSQDDGGSIMALQAMAVAEARGIDTRNAYWPLLSALDEAPWDANLAFACSELLATRVK